MGEAVTGSGVGVDVVELEEQLSRMSEDFASQISDLTAQHSSDIEQLRSEFQYDINQITETLTQVGETLGEKIDLLVEAIDLHTQDIIEHLYCLESNDLIIYEVLLYIFAFLLVGLVVLFGWLLYKFLRIFF